MKISTITTVYKESLKYVSQTLDSLISQTYTDLEIIIGIDDPQRADIEKYLKQITHQDQRIRYFINTRNLGLTKSLNKAIKQSTGAYIARLDSGDIAHHDRLAKQAEYFHRYPNTHLLACACEYIDTKGTIIGKPKQITRASQIDQMLLEKNIFIHSSIMFKKGSTKPYRDKFIYAQDYDFYLNLLSQNKQIRCLPDQLVQFRLDSSSISFTQKYYQYQFAQKAKEFYFERMNHHTDSYKSFNPASILKLKPKMDLALLKKTVISLIDMHDDQKARDEFYSNAGKVVNLHTFPTVIILFAITTFPSITRKIR